jgi:flagellar motility protein MotE (MotC chaperone)
VRATPRGVRYDPDLGEFQMRCGDCSRRSERAFWPLTLEFWEPKHGMNRCKACHNEIKARRVREALRADPARKAAKYAANREQRRVKGRIYEERRRNKVVQDPELLQRRRDLHRAATARYRAKQKEAAA